MVSAAARITLALRGGQYFFGDEGRFERGEQLYLALLHGNFAGVRSIVAQPEHALFPWVGAVVTAIQHLLAQATPFGDWSNSAALGLTIRLGSSVLSLFSALNIFLTHRLARLAGADEEEAGWVLLLMAAANTGLYFSRHLLPYDCALSVALLALLVGLRHARAGAAFGCGWLSVTAYHVYNGYWYLVPAIWLAYILTHRKACEGLRRYTAYAAGAALGFFLPIGLGVLAGGSEYLSTLGAFSRSATQGLFAEGWSLPWEYFWRSEGLAGLALAALFGAVTGWSRWHGVKLPARVSVTLATLGCAYLLLVLFSVGLERFVVYARTIKPWIVAFCLLGGWSIATLLRRNFRSRIFMLTVICGVGATHFLTHVTRLFPREIEIGVLKDWGNPKHTLSVSGSLYVPLALPVARPDLALVNAQLLYPVRAEIGYPAGQDIFRVTHPLAYPPFQYESHTPRERAFLRTHDISIRLIKLSAPAEVPDDLPVDSRYRTEERPTGR